VKSYDASEQDATAGGAFEATQSGFLAILDVSPVVKWEHLKHEPAGAAVVKFVIIQWIS